MVYNGQCEIKIFYGAIKYFYWKNIFYRVKIYCSKIYYIKIFEAEIELKNNICNKMSFLYNFLYF